MKREPTLFDMITAGKQYDYAPPRNVMLQAKRFVFDDSASAFLGMLTRAAAIEILPHHEFAKPSYDVMWVERQQRIHHKYTTGRESADPNTDEKVGYLYLHGKVYTFAGGGGKAYCGPFRYHLHEPFDLEYEHQISDRLGVSRLSYHTNQLGYIPKSDDPNRSAHYALLKEVSRSHRMEVMDHFDHVPTDQMRVVFEGMGGELRGILFTLLLLCRSNGVRMQRADVDRTRSLLKGRSVIYYNHNVVSINLSRKYTAERAIASFHETMTKRRHAVRGHWAQTRQHPPCTHDWDIVEVDKYQCVRCGAKRWWRKAHYRGDATKGFVTKSYDVTAKPN